MKKSEVSVSLIVSLGAFACAAALIASPASAAEEEEPHGPTFTGHIDLVTRYFLRGITTTYGNSKPGLGNEFADAPESDQPAVQWGVDYALPNGFAVGYWASTINYSYQRLGASYSNRSIVDDFQENKSIENDLYASYTGSFGDLGYVIGGTGYLYMNGKNADAVESKLGLTYGSFSLNAQTLLNDVVWGNRGDTYLTLNYSTHLPYNLSLTASLGYYFYEKEGKYLGTRDTFLHVDCAADEAFNVNGCYKGHRPESSAFRHFILGVTQPLGETGLVWGAQAILGGDNRFGVSQANRFIASITYGF